MDQNEKKSLFVEPNSLIRDIIENFWTVILAALIGIMGVSLYAESIYTPEYTSTATLIANIRNSSSYSTYSNLSVSSEMAQMFTSILVQPSMKKLAAENLGYDSFKGRVETSLLSGTNIFTVSVTADSPITAYNELSSLLEVYPEITDTVMSSDAVIDIMRAPDLPQNPSNSIPYRSRSKSAIVFALADMVVIALFSIMRDTVKTAESFSEKIDATLVSTIVHERPHGTIKSILKHKKTARLINDPFASYKFCESYGKLTTKIEYAKRTTGKNVILITSVAENEGKSTVAANLALSLAERGNKVALLDMDFKKPAIHKIFSVKPSKNADLGALFAGKTELANFRLRQYKDTSLYLACNNSAHEDYVDWIHSGRVKEIIDSFQNGVFDYCIIDTPPLFVAADVPILASNADSSYVVLRTDCVQVGDINDVLQNFSSESKNFVGCILNDVYGEFSLPWKFGNANTSVDKYYMRQSVNAEGDKDE